MTHFAHKSLTTLSLLIACFTAIGCNVCEDTDAKFCADLGAEDCALWKEHKFNFVAQAEENPGREKFFRSMIFGKGSAVCQSASNDAVYPQMLEAFKAQITAQRKADELTGATNAE